MEDIYLGFMFAHLFQAQLLTYSYRILIELVLRACSVIVEYRVVVPFLCTYKYSILENLQHGL